MEILLIPYEAPYGIDENYLKCPECNKIISKEKMKHKALEGPLGSVGPKKPKFEVVDCRRRKITVGPNASRDSEVFDISDYPMTPDGREDSDLRHYANSGIVTSVIDSDSDNME